MGAMLTFNYMLPTLGQFIDDNNNNLINQTHIKTSQSIEYDKPTKKQRIVLLAGPHKTGSTSVQTNIANWSLSGILEDWSWPCPQNDAYAYNKQIHAKCFARLLWALDNRSKKVMNPHETQLMYSKTFQRLWNNNKSIVFGAEYTDHVIANEFEGELIIGNLMRFMPCYPCNIYQIEVVITYRTPRVTHLISLWHQISKQNNVTHLSEFIQRVLHTFFFIINPLGMAQRFAMKNISTRIIDTSGIARQNIDLSLVIACHILKVSCENNTIIGLINNPVRLNVFTKKYPQNNLHKDVSENKLQAIEKVLQQFDCKYLKLKQMSNVEILYQDQLFHLCSNNSFFFSVNNTIQKIINITTF
eukprot:222588_1